jgi:hypothetical protein
MGNIHIKIETTADLKDIEAALTKYNIHTFNVHESQNRIIDQIIWDSNPLRIEYNRDKLVSAKFTGNFELFRDEMEKHFSQFGYEDRIKQLIEKINLDSDHTRNLTDEQREIINKKGGKNDLYANIVKIKKNSVKITWARSNRDEINELFQLLQCDLTIPYYSEYSPYTGGDIVDATGTTTVRIFKNGSIEVKGEIVTKLNELFIAKYNTKPNYIVTGDVNPEGGDVK